MISNFWFEFGILFVASLVGGLAIMPYSMRLLEGSTQKKPLKMSVSTLKLLSFLQTAVLSAIAIGVGLFAAHKIGLGAPYIEAALAGSGSLQSFAFMIEIAIILGVLAGTVLLIADLFFLPYWPEQIVDTSRKTTLWENFFASLYGGINEELLMRLFGFSVLVWLLSFVWYPNIAIFWIVNIVMAVVFGIGHLPALKGLVGKISPVMLARTLLLNAPVGLICGWLFWTYGIEAAMVAHFSADIVYHVVGTIVLRRKLGVKMK
ncbi:MAG TPA: hypothetical protein VMR99_00475 [Candidatus Paceibacterota bacterium]|nr:hypothetical protein [Candidatus Paceibacterota bacterium]